MDNLALVDMDGSIVDLDAVMRRGLESLRSPNDPTFEHGDELPEWMEARRFLLMTQPGFWRNLPRHEPGFDIVRMLEDAEFILQHLDEGSLQEVGRVVREGGVVP